MAPKTLGGMSCPVRAVNLYIIPYLSITCRYITFVNMLNVLVMILSDCYIRDIVCNNTVKGTFAG